MKRLVVFCALVFMVLGWFSPSRLYGQTYNEGFWLNEARPSLDKIVDPTGPVTFTVALPFRDALEAQTNHAEFAFYLKAYMAEASLVEAGRSFDLELLAKVYLEPTDATLPPELVPSPVSGGGEYWKLPLTQSSREAILWSDLNTKIKQRITSGHAYRYKAVQIRIQGVCKTGEPTNPNFNIQSIAGVSGDPRAKYVNNWVKLVAGYKAKIDFSVEGVQVGPSTPVYNAVDREIRGQKSVSFAWTVSGNPAHVGVPAYKLQIVKLEHQSNSNLASIKTYLTNYYACESWIAVHSASHTSSPTITQDEYDKMQTQLGADYRNGKLLNPIEPDWKNALELIVVNSTQAQVFLPYGTGFYTWRVVPLGTTSGKLSMGNSPTDWMDFRGPKQGSDNYFVSVPSSGVDIAITGPSGVSSSPFVMNSPANPFQKWIHLNDRLGITAERLRIETVNTAAPYSGTTGYTRTPESAPLFFFHDPDSARNRVYQRVVLEDNNVKEVEQFANGLDQLTQTQTALSSDGKVVIVEKKYDFGGREVVETLPAVQDQPEGLAGYKKRQTMPYDPAQPNFYRPYNAFDFDNEDRIRAPRRINDKRNGYDFYGSGPVGSAQYYPFRRTIFDLFDDKRLAEKSGFGAEFRIHPPLTEGASVHTSRYLYGKPTQDEIDRMFGEGVAPLASQTTKEIDVDANGTKTIKYLNMEGKVIATAIGFSDNKKLEESLDGEELPTPTALLGRGEYDGAVRRARTNLIVAPENLSGSSFGVVLDYTYETPPSLEGKFCEVQDFSVEYETYIRITRTDGSIWTSLNLPPSVDGGTTSQFEIESDARIITLKTDQKLRFLFKVTAGAASIDPINFSGTSPYPFAKAFLGVGSYEIEKVLVCKTSPNIVVSASEEASHRQTEPLVNLLKEWMGLQGSNSCGYKYSEFVGKVKLLIADIQRASTGGMSLADLDGKYKMLCRYTPRDPACAALLSSYQYCNCMNEAERSGGGTTTPSINCNDAQLQSQFASCFPDKFFASGHSVQFLPAGATGDLEAPGAIMPVELLITTPCCQLVMPILMDDEDQCLKEPIPASPSDAKFVALDKNHNGVLEVNPFYGNKDLREMLPDFEGYAYNYFWSCADLAGVKGEYVDAVAGIASNPITRKVGPTQTVTTIVYLKTPEMKRMFDRAMHDLEYVRLSALDPSDPNLAADMADNALRIFHIYEKYLRPNMGGYEKAGTFNLMVNKMLTDQLSCDGRQAVLKPSSSGGLDEEMVSLRDWPAERAACETNAEKLVKADKSFWLMKATAKEEFKYNWDNTYNCQDLFRCWTVQLNNIKQSAGSGACKQTPDGGNIFPTGAGTQPSTSPNNNTPSQNFDGESSNEPKVHNNHLKDNIKLGALASLFGAKRKIRRLINRIGNQVRNSQQPQQNANPPGPCSGPAGDDPDSGDPDSGCNTATCDDNVPDDNTEDDACSTCSTCAGEDEVETVETRYTYHLVEEFLNCAGRRFQRILFDVNDPAQVFRVDTENGVAKSYTSDPVGGQQKYPLDVDKRTSGVDYDIPKYVDRVDERTSKKQVRRSMAYGRYLIDMAWAASAYATPAGTATEKASYRNLLRHLKVSKKDASGNIVLVDNNLDISSTTDEYYVNGKRFRLWDEKHFVYLTLDLQPIDGSPVVPVKGEIRLITERYSGVNDLYVPSWVWNGLPDAGGEKDPFAFIFDPVYAYKYFTYYPDMYSSLEVETCFRDPNALHTTNASNQEVVTPYIAAGGAGIQTLSKHPYDPTTGAVSTSSMDVPLVPYCELGYKYCLSTRRDWSCGQRESFYSAIANYREPSDNEIDGLTQCLFVTPDDFTSIGTVIPVISPYNESNTTPDYTHLRFYPWDIERTQLDVAAPADNPAIDPNAEVYTKVSYTFPGSIRKVATVPRYRNDRYSYLELASTGYRPTFMAYSANKTPALRKFISDLPLRSLVEIQLNQMNRRVAQTCHEQYNSIRIQIERTLLENGYSIGNCVTNCDKTVTPDDISEMAWSMVDECLARGIVTTYRTTQTRCRSSYARSTTAGYVDRQDHIMAAIPGVEYGVVDESNLHRPVTSASNLPCDDAAAGCPAGFPSSLQSKVLTARRFWPCATCATTNTMALPVDATVKNGSTFQPVSKYFWNSAGAASSSVMNSIFQSVGSMGNTPAAFASGSAGPSGTSADFNIQLDDYFQNMQGQFPYVEVSAGAERNYITTTVPNPRDLGAAPQKYFVYEVKPSAPSSQITYLGLTRHREVTSSPTVVYGLRLDDVWLPNASAPVAPPYATSGNPLEECSNPPTAANQFFSPTLQPGRQSPLLSVDQDISMSFLPGTHGQNTSGVAEGGKPPREFLFYRVQINDLDDHSAPQAREVIHTESQHLIEQP